VTPGIWVLIGAVVLALAFGFYRAYADGRFRGTHAVRGVSGDRTDDTSDEPVETPNESLTDALGPDVVLGERATLLQFSSAFCAPCRAARRTLADAAALVPGVVHVEVDAESHLDLVRRLGILRTPTTLVLDQSGVEVARAAGAPTRDQVLAQLGALA
jgi:thiol-disulfide isomerase/thioredoxin